jgi:hypothetical protein
MAAGVRAAGSATVVLDRVQDAGNVGSILRSASAFGFRQVLALKGSAALWSPKVLRAGMGAHFALHLVEGLSEDDLGCAAGAPVGDQLPRSDTATCTGRICPGPVPGSWGTKGRAWPRRWKPAHPCASALRNLAVKSL